MSVTYDQLPIGTMPSPLKKKWQKWYFDLLAQRVSECAGERTTKIYFSQAGNDTTGNGSIATPYKTLDKAQDLIDAFTAGDVDTAFYFKRGDEWLEDLGMKAGRTIDNFAVLDYGDSNDAKPLFSAFTIQFTSGWTLVTGTTYKRTETRGLAWLRDNAKKLKATYQCYNQADVETYGSVSAQETHDVSGAFWYDKVGDELFVNFGVDPNTITIETLLGTGSNDIGSRKCGVSISGDGCYCRNIRADGYGLPLTSDASTATQTTGMKCGGGVDDSIVFQGCESYWSGSHTFTYNSGVEGGGGGAFFTLIDCKTGWTQNNGLAGNTSFNYFHSGSNAANGEAIFHQCEALYGTLPDRTKNTKNGGRAFYGHTNGGTNKISLALFYKCLVPEVKWSPADFGAINNLDNATGFAYTAEGIDKVRQIEYGTQFLGTAFEGSFTNNIQVNCYYRMKSTNSAQEAFYNSQARGLAVNSIYDVDLSEQTVSPYGFVNAQSATSDWRLVNCNVIIRHEDSTRYINANTNVCYAIFDRDAYFGDDAGLTDLDYYLENCVIECDNPNTNTYMCVGDGSTLNNNLYINIKDGGNNIGTGRRAYSALDSNKIESVEAEVLALTKSQIPYAAQPVPASNSTRYKAGVANALFMPEFDFYNNTRDMNNPSIGAFDVPGKERGGSRVSTF